MQMQVIPPLATRLAEHPDPADHWLSCLECDRFFHISSVRRDNCPFSDCYGGGLGIMLVFWDSTRVPEDPRWPASVAELHHGMRVPDYESFAQARLEERTSAIVSELEAAPEYGELVTGPPRYVRPFLKMMSDFCCNLTEVSEPTFISELSGELILDLPVWARVADPNEAPRMVWELRALFAFAERTNCLSDAAEWKQIVADDRLEAWFKRTMLDDRRLRRERRALISREERPLRSRKPRRPAKRRRPRPHRRT